MRQLDYPGQFKRDVKRAQKRGKDLGKLKALLSLLIESEPLPATSRIPLVHKLRRL